MSQTILGQMVNIIACPRCNGEGRIIATPCHSCHGDGRVREERTLEVAVPAGIDSGQRIALEGQGEAGPRGGPPGDLYVAVTVRDHPELVRRGTELYHELPITFPQAALGATVRCRRSRAPRTLQVPAGTQSGNGAAPEGARRAAPARQRPRRPARHRDRGGAREGIEGERELLRQLGEVSAPAVLPKGSGSGLFDRLRDIFG